MAYRIVILLGLLLAGCTVFNVRRFRVVDATDGHALEGVHAQGSERIPNFDAPYWPIILTKSGIATSDQAGLVQFDPQIMGVSSVTFEKQGYEPCEVVSSWPGYRPSNWLERFHVFGWEDQATAVIKLQPSKGE